MVLTTAPAGATRCRPGPTTPHPVPVKLLSLARDLKRRKARERNGSFVAEGVRTVECLLQSALPVTGLLAAHSLDADERGTRTLAQATRLGIAVLRVSDAEFASSASTDTPQGVLAIAEVPIHTLKPAETGDRFLVLDGIQDPGNAGTIIRSAAAFGTTATLCLPGTVDVWNAKVVRSSMGALFTHPVLRLSPVELADFLAAHKVPCWAADTQGTPLGALAGCVPDTLALVVSNEGAGLSAHVAALATHRVAIVMATGVESLNVAVATGILLHGLQYSRRLAAPPA